MIGILINKIRNKIITLLNLGLSKDAIKKMRRGLPTFSLALGIILLTYMNVTGFRLVIFSGGGNTTMPTNNLWIVGLCAASIFFLILLLFYRKAIKNKNF